MISENTSNRRGLGRVTSESYQQKTLADLTSTVKGMDKMNEVIIKCPSVPNFGTQEECHTVDFTCKHRVKSAGR